MFDEYEKALIKQFAQQMDADGMIYFISNPDQQHTIMSSVVDQQISDLGLAINGLDDAKAARQAGLQDQIDKLTAFKTKLEQL